jgi:uncharacterized protein with PIN domain
MDLEEREGVEPVKDRCENCGAKLTKAELEAILVDGASETFLCSRCAVEVVEEDVVESDS